MVKQRLNPFTHRTQQPHARASIVGTVHGSRRPVGDPRFKPLHTVGADDQTDRSQAAEQLVRRVTLTAQLLVTAPRTLAAGHCDARKCSRSRSHIDQDLSASTAPVRLTTLTPSSDASATSPASVELDTACRLESCSRLCSHRCMGRMSIETMSSRACGP